MTGIQADKTMFEVYREKSYEGAFRVVYYTELDEHNKESEINRAMAGEHFIDGYIRNYGKDEAKKIIEGLVERLNSGEQLSQESFLAALGEHIEK